MPKRIKMRATNLNIEPEQYEALRLIGELTDGHPKLSGLVRQALTDFIDSRAAKNPELAARLAALKDRRLIPLQGGRSRRTVEEKGGV